MKKLAGLSIFLLGVAYAMEPDVKMAAEEETAPLTKRKSRDFRLEEAGPETKKSHIEKAMDESTLEFKMKVLDTIIELLGSNVISDQDKDSLKTSIIVGELDQSPSKIKQQIYLLLIKSLQMGMVKGTDNAVVFKIATDFGFKEIIRQLQYFKNLPRELVHQIILQDKFVHNVIRDIAKIVRNNNNAEATDALETLKSMLLVNKEFQQIIKSSSLKIDLSEMVDEDDPDTSSINDQVLSIVVDFFPGITELNIGTTDVTNEGLKTLNKLINIKSLILWDLGLTDEGIANLGNLTSLTNLNLGGNNISDNGLTYLLNLKNLTSLSLNNNNQLTDAGIVNLKNLPNLIYLDVNSCKNITREGLVGLKKDLPNLTIESNFILEE